VVRGHPHILILHMCVAVRCSVLQCVAVRCSVLQCVLKWYEAIPIFWYCTCVLQCVAVCCSVLQCVWKWCEASPILIRAMLLIAHVTVTWRIYRCSLSQPRVLSRIWVSHGTRMHTSCHTVMSHIWTFVTRSSHVTHMNESWHAHIWVMSHSHVTHIKPCYARKDAYSRTQVCRRNMCQNPYVCYGVATMSRLLKIIGLFCRISSLL